MVNEKDFFNSLLDEDKCMFACIRWTLFCQWQIKLYASTKELYNCNQVDTFLQDIFYIKLHGYLNEGYKYIKNYQHLYASYLPQDYAFIIEHLRCEVEELIGEISKEEMSYIEYRRHTAAHMFQPNYDLGVILPDTSNKIKKVMTINNHIDSRMESI